ncbi:MAG: DUF86 domain-containing protein [Deltaproteobacteria bacterium]|nr:DUF86 domain-containing protein [Deltaproteobacteria bacterium]
MVNEEKILQKFIQIDEYLSFLNKISKSSEQAFLKDKILIGSAKYYLQISIECCLDVVNHIIASERFRAPRDYADSFSILEENGILESSLVIKLRQMAKFRNRLVHLYGEIDDKFVYEFIKKDIEDIRKFQSIITNNYIK